MTASNLYHFTLILLALAAIAGVCCLAAPGAVVAFGVLLVRDVVTELCWQ